MQTSVDVEFHSTLLELYWRKSHQSASPGSELKWLCREQTPVYTGQRKHLIVIALQGVVNRLSFPPICSGWRVHAHVGRYLLFLSVAGRFSWDEHWQCQWWGGWKVRG